eukprot:TRINITY_DN651_c0_g1_i1.p1 TRINITY_DN651_c0_g1~~TRINITY_DN651_c0_g1_i1.p1  ORF type:complete len:498 (-),score=35.57 TRINITY_DN651_c0_g1_i1:11-1504(-)
MSSSFPLLVCIVGTSSVFAHRLLQATTQISNGYRSAEGVIASKIVAEHIDSAGEVTAECPTDYVLTGCTCDSHSPCCDGGRIDGNRCTVKNSMEACTDRNRWGSWSYTGQLRLRAVATCWHSTIIKDTKVEEKEGTTDEPITLSCSDDYKLSDCRCSSEEASCAGVDAINLDVNSCTVSRATEFTLHPELPGDRTYRSDYNIKPGPFTASIVCIQPHSANVDITAGAGELSTAVSEVVCPHGYGLLGCQCTGPDHACTGSPIESASSCRAQNRRGGQGVKSMGICLIPSKAAQSGGAAASDQRLPASVRDSLLQPSADAFPLGASPVASALASTAASAKHTDMINDGMLTELGQQEAAKHAAEAEVPIYITRSGIRTPGQPVAPTNAVPLTMQQPVVPAGQVAQPFANGPPVVQQSAVPHAQVPGALPLAASNGVPGALPLAAPSTNQDPALATASGGVALIPGHHADPGGVTGGVVERNPPRPQEEPIKNPRRRCC